MKLADAIGLWLKEKGVKHVFGVSGGASLHLIHGIHNAGISFIPTAHEQGAAFCADAYCRIRGIGVAVATSGPGATNLITGIATSYYDSVPTLYLTGNVTTGRASKLLGVRQYGFQDCPIVDLVREITKDAVQIRIPCLILEILNCALKIANEGRKGPVLIDIPDDIQRANI